MSRKFSQILLIVTILTGSALMMTANAIPVPGSMGQLRIEPHAFDDPDPTILSSPATFTVSAKNHDATNPQILLVISENCYDGLGANAITIDWNYEPYPAQTEIYQGDFTWIDPADHPTPWVPPVAEVGSKIYKSSSLRDHLGVPEDEGIWYAYVPLKSISEIAAGEEYEFTITVSSSTVRVLVYAFGECIKVPPTRPGFIIPEVPMGPVVSILAMVAAFAMLSRRSVPIKI